MVGIVFGQQNSSGSIRGFVGLGMGLRGHGEGSRKLKFICTFRNGKRMAKGMWGQSN